MHPRVEFITEDRVSHLTSMEDSGWLHVIPFTPWDDVDPSVVVVPKG